ncbi:MAG: PKD domain-containing protein [Candidatus Thermoplasmatota archaeon]|nr:PKD domain-containing protein [Candidatus Thermoplasmatota archaeon]
MSVSKILFFPSFIIAMTLITSGLPLVKTQHNIQLSEKYPINVNLKRKDISIEEEFESIFSNSFEQNIFPPSGWELQRLNLNFSWHQDSVNAQLGNYSACCLHDSNNSWQDEWMITPKIDVSNHSDIFLSFNWFMSYFWSVDPYDNYDLNVYVSKGNETRWQKIWNEREFGLFENWVWYNTSENGNIDLSDYCDNHFIQLGFQYNGSNGAQLNIDNIGVYGRRITNPPVVDAGGPYEAYVGDEIEFIANITGGEQPFEWSWDFGDNTQSSRKVPVHTYDKVGIYSVRLQVKDANGISDADETSATIINMSKVPELIIENISGYYGIHAGIANKGCVDATNIEWQIKIHGGFNNQIIAVDTGSIPYLKQNCCCEINSNEFHGFGLVNVIIFVEADNMHRISKRCTGLLFGQYFITISGSV